MSKLPVRRCAVYTRKSSEEGLEQDFNSLHAQREACEAYIKSQVGEGWKLVPTPYDDGGISGGTMERPGLQRLLADIGSGLIDVVVVYKVDRLTRSLADFAKMVEVFDARGVSFVAVTQQFNTTSSMGRLTLNVLLSFAQFEREVTGERIRDKIAASKKKGMWMGGFVSLGYDVVDRKLVINAAEAETIREIFRRYLALGNVRLLKMELDRRGIRSKARMAKGRSFGATSFSRGALYKILSNPIYIGEIAHKELRHAGQHEPIIDRELWDTVQSQLADQRGRALGTGNRSTPKPLMKKLFDDSGRCLTPVSSSKRGRRNHYYVSPTEPGMKTDARRDWRLPALEIERTVTVAAQTLLKDNHALTEAMRTAEVPNRETGQVFKAAEALAEQLGSDIQGRELLGRIVERVDLSGTGFHLTLAVEAGDTLIHLKKDFPMRMKRRGVEMRMVLGGPAEPNTYTDPGLIKAVRNAHRWFEEIATGKVKSMAEIARRERLDKRFASRVLYLAFLSPRIVEAILDGTQPLGFTANALCRDLEIDPDWDRQHQALGLIYLPALGQTHT